MKEPVSRSRGCRYYANLAVVAVLLLCAGLYVVIPVHLCQLYLHPPRMPLGDASPADLGLDFEAVALTTEDGVSLSGWYIPSQNGAAVVAVHGHGTNRTVVLPHSAVLARNGYGVLLFDMRAHGESGGDVFPFGWDVDRDIRAAVDYLSGRTDVTDGRIGVLGLSAGAGAALQAAAEDPRVRAVVAEGTGFRTVADMFVVPSAANLSRAPGVWVMENVASLQSGVASPPPTAELTARIAPRAVFLIAADTPEERLPNRAYIAAAGEPRTLWEPERTGHVAALEIHPDEYEQRVIGFFDGALLEEQPD